MSWDDHEKCLAGLKEAQEAEHDMREQAREALAFVSARNGQWEDKWWSQNEGKPRYTFDLIDPIIDQVCGESEKQDFSIAVTPMGGKADEDIADVYEGLIRAIERKSGASHTYNAATRNCATSGVDGWRVVQKYADGDSFDQDLAIEPIHNYVDRVWHGFHEQADASDAKCCWILAGLTRDEFRRRFPDASESGVEQDRVQSTYYHRRDLVMVGEYVYLKEKPREIVKMSNGAVYAADELESVLDELAAAGITEEARRKRKELCVYSRLFSENEWLTEPRETVFRNWLPVIPLYSSFRVVNDKITYRGVVERLMDPQRVFNYSLSREIEEGALAPRAKYWMTLAQAEGFEETLASMNTNTDPVQFFNPDPELPGPPMQNGGAQVNPGLRNISEAMRQIVGMTAGLFAANMGDNPGLQSGVAIEALQDRGDNTSNKFIVAREIAQRQTGKIIVDAIPRVYTPSRQIRILGEDGTQESVTVGQTIIDNQTGQLVVLNDLSQGEYDVDCHSGPSFRSRQNETVHTLVELGKVDPEVIQLGGDILASNVHAPGMDEIAARKRLILFKQGLIPPEQMTDEEQAMMQAQAQQPPQESPEMVLARAEEAKAQADAMSVQQKLEESRAKNQIEMQKIQLEGAKLELEKIRLQIDAQKAGVEIKLTGAQAAKVLAEAEAQEMESVAFESGITKLMERARG